MGLIQGEFLAAPTVRQGAAGQPWAPGWYHENGNYYPKTQEPEVAGNSGFFLTFISFITGKTNNL